MKNLAGSPKKNGFFHQLFSTNFKTLEGLLSLFVIILLLKFFVFGLFMPSIADEAVHIHEAYLTSQGLRPDVDFYLQYHPLRVYLYSALYSLLNSPFVFVVVARTLNLALLVFLAFMINKLYTEFTRLSSRLPGLIFILGSSVSNFAMHNAQIKPDFLSLLFFVYAMHYLHRFLFGTPQKKCLNLSLASLFVALSGMTSSKILFPLIALNLWLIWQERKKKPLQVIADAFCLDALLGVSFAVYIISIGGIRSYIYNHVILVSGISTLNMGLAGFIVDSFKEAIQAPFMVLFILLVAYFLIAERRQLFKANSRPTVILALLFIFFQLIGNIFMNFRIGYLTPHLIPFALLIVPYIQQQDEKRERLLKKLALLAFILYLVWMAYIHAKLFSYMLDPTDYSSGYKTLSEQAADYGCLNISSDDYYFGFYEYFFHPIFVKDSGYYYVASKMDRLENYTQMTDDSLKKATLIIMPENVRMMNPTDEVSSSLDNYSGYIAQNFEKVCIGPYLRRISS